MAVTPEQLKANFRQQGKTFKDFATQHNFPYCEVVRVVNGLNKARRGQGHDIAVKLGLKDRQAA
jgi:gp16 family phage-associated protein